MNKQVHVRNTPYYDGASLRALTPQQGGFQQPYGMPTDFGAPPFGPFGAPQGGFFGGPAGGPGPGGGGLAGLFGGGVGAGGPGGPIPGLMNSLNNIRVLIDRMGGIDGVLDNVQKAHKIMGTLQQMGPMVKLLLGTLKKSKDSDNDETSLPARRRRRRRRRRNGSSRKLKISTSKNARLL